MSTQHQPDETLSTESQRRLHALFESWRESRPHWTEECYEAFCAGCMEGYASKAPQIEEAVKPLQAQLDAANARLDAVRSLEQKYRSRADDMVSEGANLTGGFFESFADDLEQALKGHDEQKEEAVDTQA